MSINCQTLEGDTEFDGTEDQGKWDFTSFNAISQRAAIRITIASYVEDGTPPPNLSVAASFFAFRIGEADITKRIPLGSADGTGSDVIDPVTGNFEFLIDEFFLPREPDGEWWSVILLTDGKEHPATACVSWEIVELVTAKPNISC